MRSTDQRSLTSPKNGESGGRPTKLNHNDIALAGRLFRNTAMTAGEISKQLGVGRATLYRFKEDWMAPVIRVAIEDLDGLNSRGLHRKAISQASVLNFEISISKLIGRQLKCRIQFVPMQFKSILPAIKDGLVDIGLGRLASSPLREKSADFTEAYTSTGSKTHVRMYSVKNKIKITSLEQLCGFSVGTIGGSLHEDFLKSQCDDSVRIKYYSSLNKCFTNLSRSKVDFVIAHPHCVADYPKEVLGIQEMPIEIDYGVATGIAVNKHQPNLKDQINEILYSAEKNGVLNLLTDYHLERKVSQRTWKNENFLSLVS